MMGAGKTTIGKGLAKASGREFLDTDALIERRLGRTVQQVFKIYTEQAFRDHETSILRSLAPGRAVISTGGGIVLRDQNWDEMRRIGITVYLDASAESIIGRLKFGRKKRPLLQTQNWQQRVREILSCRQDLYRKADITVNLDHMGVEQAIQAVLRAIQDYERSARSEGTSP